jgi:HEPN domain-containing protein
MFRWYLIGFQWWFNGVFKEKCYVLRKESSRSTSEGMYSFTLYFAEQSLQLYIKYILRKELGYYPKAHSFSILFDILGKITPGAETFCLDNIEIFELLEDAYITVST